MSAIPAAGRIAARSARLLLRPHDRCRLTGGDIGGGLGRAAADRALCGVVDRKEKEPEEAPAGVLGRKLEPP
jgi:hypothetical protein